MRRYGFEPVVDGAQRFDAHPVEAPLRLRADLDQAGIYSPDGCQLAGGMIGTHSRMPTQLTTSVAVYGSASSTSASSSRLPTR